jgi:insulin gene enhancer protein ISL-1
LFGTKCARCSLSFSKNDFVMRAKNKIYHIDCFRCVACSRQLIPGDEFALRDDGLFCKADHDVVENASTGSTTPIPSADDAKMNILNNNNNNNTKDVKNNIHDGELLRRCRYLQAVGCSNVVYVVLSSAKRGPRRLCRSRRST